MTLSYCGDQVLDNLLYRRPGSPVVIFELTDGLKAYQSEDARRLFRTAKFLEKITAHLGVPVEAIAAVFAPGEFSTDGESADEEGSADEHDEEEEEDGNSWFQYIETETRNPGLSMGILWREEYDPTSETFIVDHCRVEVFSTPRNFLGEEAPHLPLIFTSDGLFDL